MNQQRMSPWPLVGVGGLACVLFLYGASVLFLPWWGVVALVGCWLVLFVLAVRWFTPRPRATAVLPLVGLVLWLVAIGLAASR